MSDLGWNMPHFTCVPDVSCLVAQALYSRRSYLDIYIPVILPWLLPQLELLSLGALLHIPLGYWRGIGLAFLLVTFFGTNLLRYISHTT